MVLFVAPQRFIEDADILADFVHLKEQRARIGPETALKCVQHAVWGILYPNDACMCRGCPAA